MPTHTVFEPLTNSFMQAEHEGNISKNEEQLLMDITTQLYQTSSIRKGMITTLMSQINSALSKH
jgi:hypothetical protein